MKLILASIFFILSTISFAQTSAPYSFFVAGHVSGTPGVDNIGLHPEFKNHFPYIINRNEIELGVFTGDIVRAFPYPLESDWIEVDNDVSTLGIPVHYAVGNHDMENREVFESRYGKTYYSFTYQNDLFMVLDPNLDHWNISDDQLSFISQVLDTSSANNLFVFVHQVLWKEENTVFNYIKWNSDEGRADSINFWSSVIPLFDKGKRPVYFFAGDVGSASYASALSYDRVDNFTFISSGMGNMTDENFLVVNVSSSKEITYDVICTSANEYHCLGDLTDHKINDLLHIEPFINPTNTVTIYPNPAINNTLLQFPEITSGKVEIFNLNGQFLNSVLFSEQYAVDINTSNYSKGIYLIQIKTSEEMYQKKLVVK
ncbi:MAG: T9SS type A sorting domain-containing protein [Salibacteraceae bacterium]